VVLNGVAVRDHTDGLKAKASIPEGELELHALERVVEAHTGSYVGVCGKIQNGKGCIL
jgi:hypothetical protein